MTCVIIKKERHTEVRVRPHDHRGSALGDVVTAEEPPEPPEARGVVLLPSLRGSVTGPHLDFRTSGLLHWGEHMLLL